MLKIREANVKARFSNENTPFCAAISDRHFPAGKILFKRRADVNLTNYKSSFPLAVVA